MTQRIQMKILFFWFCQVNFAFIGRIQQLLPSDLSQQLKLLKGVNTS